MMRTTINLNVAVRPPASFQPGAVYPPPGPYPDRVPVVTGPTLPLNAKDAAAQYERAAIGEAHRVGVPLSADKIWYEHPDVDGEPVADWRSIDGRLQLAALVVLGPGEPGACMTTVKLWERQR